MQKITQWSTNLRKEIFSESLFNLIPISDFERLPKSFCLQYSLISGYCDIWFILISIYFIMDINKHSILKHVNEGFLNNTLFTFNVHRFNHYHYTFFLLEYKSYLMWRCLIISYVKWLTRQDIIYVFRQDMPLCRLWQSFRHRICQKSRLLCQTDLWKVGLWKERRWRLSGRFRKHKKCRILERQEVLKSINRFLLSVLYIITKERAHL